MAKDAGRHTKDHDAEVVSRILAAQAAENLAKDHAELLNLIFVAEQSHYLSLTDGDAEETADIAMRTLGQRAKEMRAQFTEATWLDGGVVALATA
jgi:hypothetical protein